MKRRYFGYIVSLSLLVFCGFQIFSSHGIVGVTRKPNHKFVNPGCICHSDTSSTFVHVQITGPESLGEGEIGNYTLSVIKDSNIAAGFNVASFFGSLMVGDTLDEQLMEDELTHTHPKLANNNDTILWTFHYQAPEVSIFDTLYAAGNSVDTSQDPSGDYWNLSDNFIVRVGNPVSVVDNASPVPVHFQLLQNYPNPFNPTTHISYRLQRSAQVRLVVHDVTGREITRLVDHMEQAGEHQVVFEAKNLSSGIYFYRLATDDFVQARKMVLVR